MTEDDHAGPGKQFAQGHSWLTAKQLRAHGTILALCLWSLYLWNVATPGLRDRNGNLKGTDFLHLYTLGSLAAAHRGADLYDINTQASLAAERVPEAAGIRYLPLYPPQVSIFFAPLAHFSYGWALLIWWSSSIVAYGICSYIVWRACPNLREYGGTVALLAVAFPAFFHLVAWGQTSAAALACFTLMFFLLRARKEFLAGLALGCLIFKPQLGLAAAIVFISIGALRTVLGAVVSALAQLSVGVLYYGMEPLRQWARMLRHVQALMLLLEPKLYQTHSLRTFWSMIVPEPRFSFGLYILSAIVVLGMTVAGWKRGDSVPLPLRYSTLLLASVLVAPHLTVYDLVVLAPAFMLMADWLVAQPPTPSTRWLGTLLYFSYMLPLLGPFTRWTYVQLSVVAMATTVYVIWNMACGSNLSGENPARITAASEEL
jgi:Glycosyltransferase family 87